MMVKEKIVAAFLITLLGAVEAADYSSYVQLNVVDPLNNDCSWNRYLNNNWSKNPFSNKRSRW